MSANSAPLSTQTEKDQKNTLTFAEAKKALPKGKYVHTFLQSSFMMIGADWAKKDVLAAMKEAETIHITGDQAQAMGHGIAIMHGGQMTFIATAERTDGVVSHG